MRQATCRNSDCLCLERGSSANSSRYLRRISAIGACRNLSSSLCKLASMSSPGISVFSPHGHERSSESRKQAGMRASGVGVSAMRACWPAALEHGGFAKTGVFGRDLRVLPSIGTRPSSDWRTAQALIRRVAGDPLTCHHETVHIADPIPHNSLPGSEGRTPFGIDRSGTDNEFGNLNDGVTQL